MSHCCSREFDRKDSTRNSKDSRLLKSSCLNRRVKNSRAHGISYRSDSRVNRTSRYTRFVSKVTRLDETPFTEYTYVTLYFVGGKGSCRIISENSGTCIIGRFLLSLSVYVNIREIAHRSRNALFQTSRLIKRLIKLPFREN